MSLRGLADLSGCTESDLSEALRRIEEGSAYERFEIPKLGRQKPRVITAPVDVLKRVQRAIKDLVEPLPLSNAVHGFRRGRSIVTGAQAHVDARAMINIDLTDFFHSVTADRVARTLERSLRRRWVEETEELTVKQCDAIVGLITRLATYPVPGQKKPALPQGAPCSPFIANLAARPMDSAITKLLRETPGEYVYTRYADDLTISAPHEIDRRMLGAVLEQIRRRGFRPHPEKTSIASTIKGSSYFAQKLLVTGLVIDSRERCVRIPRARMDAYRLKLHQAKHAARLTPEELSELEGIISFVHMVYGALPASLAQPYDAMVERHRLPKLEPGKSRRFARKRALNQTLYR